jgi:hypothetical protein
MSMSTRSSTRSRISVICVAQLFSLSVRSWIGVGLAHHRVRAREPGLSRPRESDYDLLERVHGNGRVEKVEIGVEDRALLEDGPRVGIELDPLDGRAPMLEDGVGPPQPAVSQYQILAELVGVRLQVCERTGLSGVGCDSVHQVRDEARRAETLEHRGRDGSRDPGQMEQTSEEGAEKGCQPAGSIEVYGGLGSEAKPPGSEWEILEDRRIGDAGARGQQVRFGKHEDGHPRNVIGEREHVRGQVHAFAVEAQHREVPPYLVRGAPVDLEAGPALCRVRGP